MCHLRTDFSQLASADIASMGGVPFDEGLLAFLRKRHFPLVPHGSEHPLKSLQEFVLVIHEQDSLLQGTPLITRFHSGEDE